MEWPDLFTVDNFFFSSNHIGLKDAWSEPVQGLPGYSVYNCTSPSTVPSMLLTQRVYCKIRGEGL